MAKPQLRIQARDLRQQGIGIKTIAHKLNVSPSTVSLWYRDIELTSEQISQLELNSHDPFYGRRLLHVKRQQEERLQKINSLRLEGIKDVAKLNVKELFIAGVSLYWAEGFKKDNQFGFSNSDPAMIKFMCYWLVQCCSIPKERLHLRVGVNEFYQNKVRIIEEFWSEILDIPLIQFQKPFFQKTQWRKEYDSPQSYHGVLRIRVTKSSELLRKMMGWIEGLKLQSIT